MVIWHGCGTASLTNALACAAAPHHASALAYALCMHARIALLAGVLKTPWGEGKWGIAPKPKGLPWCAPPNECLFVDFSGAAHHVWFDADLSKFTSVRVGDGEIVNGTRIRH